MKMELEFLADNEKLIPVIAKWYFNEWGYLSKGLTLEKVVLRLRSSLNKNKIPLIVVAKKNGDIVGACQLKFREMDIYPDKEHWLGGVYVSTSHRGKKIAEKLISKAVSIAQEIGVRKLYLQTENLSGGLYSRLGWQPIEKVSYHGLNVLVMERDI